MKNIPKLLSLLSDTQLSKLVRNENKTNKYTQRRFESTERTNHIQCYRETSNELLIGPLEKWIHGFDVDTTSKIVDGATTFFKSTKNCEKA